MRANGTPARAAAARAAEKIASAANAGIIKQNLRFKTIRFATRTSQHRNIKILILNVDKLTD